MASRLCCSADDRSGSPDAPNARHPVSAEVQRNLLPRSYQRDTHVITPNVWPAIIAPGERKPLLDIFPPTTSDENPNSGSHTHNNGAGTALRPPKTNRRFNITARIKKKLSQESTHAKNGHLNSTGQIKLAKSGYRKPRKSILMRGYLRIEVRHEKAMMLMHA